MIVRKFLEELSAEFFLKSVRLVQKGGYIISTVGRTVSFDLVYSYNTFPGTDTDSITAIMFNHSHNQKLKSLTLVELDARFRGHEFLGNTNCNVRAFWADFRRVKQSTLHLDTRRQSSLSALRPESLNRTAIKIWPRSSQFRAVSYSNVFFLVFSTTAVEIHACKI